MKMIKIMIKRKKELKKKYHGWMHNVKTYQMQVIAFYTNS